MNEMNMELYGKFAKLQWLLHKHHMRTHAQNGPMANPTRGQGRIFALLKMQDGISTKDLSYLLGIRVSSLNELLAKMEKNGYIMREASEADRRIMLVKLTDKGKNEQQEEWNPGGIFTCLSEEEQKLFADYLDRVIISIQSEIGEEADEEEHNWRERFGGEMFERFASMRHGGFPHEDGFDPHRGGPHGFGGFPHGGGFRGRPGKPPKSPQKPNESEDESLK